MKVTALSLPGVFLLESRVFPDARGFFLTTWNDEQFRREIADVAFVQDNHSRSGRGALRGLHYQLQHTQGKLIRCSLGTVWDAVVDVRRSSPTFGHWCGVELSDRNHHQLWVPAGFAHGFVVRSDVADLHYKVTDHYDPSSERALLWNDPAIGVQWPLEEGVPLLLSPKDAAGIALSEIETLP